MRLIGVDGLIYFTVETPPILSTEVLEMSTAFGLYLVTDKLMKTEVMAFSFQTLSQRLYCGLFNVFNSEHSS